MGKVDVTGFYWFDGRQINGGTVTLTANKGTIDVQFGDSVESNRTSIPFTIESGTGAFSLTSGQGKVTFLGERNPVTAKFSN
jgi:hypothetical protein